MSFWDSITGKSQQDTIQHGAAAARGKLKSGYGRAEGYNQRARGTLGQTYGQSRNVLRDARDQSVNTLNQGAQSAYGSNDNALAAVRAGGQDAIGSIRSGYAGANDYLQPYEQQGGSANTLFNDAIGANGQDAQQGYVSSYQADPSQQYVQDAIQRQYNAAGMLDSGASRLAAARAHNEGYNQRLGLLQQSGAQGYNAASQLGQYDTQEGQLVAGYQDGTGRAEAGIYGDRGNIALGNASNVANVQQGTANNIANSFQQQGSQQANSFGQSAALKQQLSQLIAAGRIQEASALMEAESAGVNNILSGLGNIAGTAISGFAPGAGGTSSAGNIFNYLQGGGLK